MPFINYETHNYCMPCENRFIKSKGIRCPICKRRARTAPRVTTKSREETYRNQLDYHYYK